MGLFFDLFVGDMNLNLQVWAYFEPTLIQIGGSRDGLGPIFAYLLGIWAYLGLSLGPFWTYSGPYQGLHGWN